MRPQKPRKAPVATWVSLGRCSACGTKATAILLTLTPCGCSTKQCMRCADNAAPAIGGPLREVDADVRAATSLALLATVTDVRDQVARLTGEGFVGRAGAARLPHLVRYLRAARHRLTRAAADPARDTSLAWQVRELEDEHRATVAAARTVRHDPGRDARHAEAGWMIEELRVSLFAQQLGTAHPVSAKRIRSTLAAAGPGRIGAPDDRSQ